MAITSAIIKHNSNNICYNLHWYNGDINISHQNIQQVGLNTSKLWLNIQILAYNKIQNYIYLHSTHSIKSGCYGKDNIFPYTR